MTFDEIKRQMHDPYSISINEVVIKPIKGQAGQGIIFPMQNFTSLRQLHDYVISTVKNRMNICTKNVLSNIAP